MAKRIGRAPKVPPRDAAARIEAMASEGYNIRSVAAGVRVSQDTLRKWFEKYPELLEAFENGREKERYALHNILFKAAEKGNVIAAMFLLKARHGYREGEQNDGGNKVQVNFTLPGAMTMDAFKNMKVIEHAKPNDGMQPVSTERAVITRGS